MRLTRGVKIMDKIMSTGNSKAANPYFQR